MLACLVFFQYFHIPYTSKRFTEEKIINTNVNDIFNVKKLKLGKKCVYGFLLKEIHDSPRTMGIVGNTIHPRLAVNRVGDTFVATPQFQTTAEINNKGTAELSRYLL